VKDFPHFDAGRLRQHQLFDEGVFEVLQSPKLACVEAPEVVDNEHIGSALIACALL
jgi:hypothetical protein